MKKGTYLLRRGIVLLALFAVWTLLVLSVDVRVAGETGREIGFATLNTWFHALTNVHMPLYELTDWLGLIPVLVCLLFWGMGFVQLVRRRSLMQVDRDLILLWIYDVLMLLFYLGFELLPINYRPILIEGRIEASYPSSTTLLVLCTMPTLVFQAKRRLRSSALKKAIAVLAAAFSLFIIAGRMLSGVHWLTDIIASVPLSAGLYCIYKGCVLRCCTSQNREAL